MEYVVEMRDLTDHLFKTLEPHPNLELIVVMVLVPFVLNTICFWINVAKNDFSGITKKRLFALMTSYGQHSLKTAIQK